MTDFFQTDLPVSNLAVRTSIYEGAVYLLPANEASRTFADAVLEEVRCELGNDYRQAHAEFDSVEFFRRVGALRKKIYSSQIFHQHVNQVIHSLGFSVATQAYDPARMRVVAHEGHLNPAAAPIYYGHRDTWYANSQAMITWWIPLHDVVAENSFEFFPEEFRRAVANDSEVFDFDDWVYGGQDKRIGWQKEDTGRTAKYPSLLEQPQGRRAPVVAKAGQILLFSAQHLHQTRENITGNTRFSLDFRTVDFRDHQMESGAANVDNRSRGSSLIQFVRPAQ